MIRIGVIQNEVEMQHSGYVDSVHKYRDIFDFGVNVFFNRFSSVNIHKLFREGEDFLLEYDCLIIGTNATSDGDVYKVLQKSENKKILGDFILEGKSLLVCSQKKLIVDDMREGYNVRKTNFLPDDYEYNIISRPKNESSADGDVYLAPFEYNNIQSYILSMPHNITEKKIKDCCISNDFQTHYYRDYIEPKKESAYFPLLLDKRTPIRNTLMVASPKKNEKIIISTMALDWAGHYDLLENIIHYLIIGIPEVAFVTKTAISEEVVKFLKSEAELNKMPYKYYDSIESVSSSNFFRYHSLFVLLPAYSENEVSVFWDTIKTKTKYTKLFHYRHINDDTTKDLILVNFSQSRQIDLQKQAVKTWLVSLYKNHLWDNSFWKTYDVIQAFTKLEVSIEPYIVGLFTDINKHYKDGSYDGVLAPTCGLLEILMLISSTSNYSSKLANVQNMLSKTISWLVKKYQQTSNYNKKFIIRAFYRVKLMDKLINSYESKEKFIDDLHSIAKTDTLPINDKLEIELCLDIETCIIDNSFSNTDEQVIRKKIKDCLDFVILGQEQSGRWDNNLGKTARILLFLMEYENKFQPDPSNSISKAIELGVNALRKAYKKNNWENNIVTTANAISALVLYDERTKNVSNEFFSQINQEVKLVSSYNSLSLALTTLGQVLELYNNSQLELKGLRRIKDRYDKSQILLYVFANIATISVLLLASYYIYLWLYNVPFFKKMLSTSLMWIPIAIGIAITAIVKFLPNFIKKLFAKKEE
jgi:hypothetical protein